jgi:hypothetical protein
VVFLEESSKNDAAIFDPEPFACGGGLRAGTFLGGRRRVHNRTPWSVKKCTTPTRLEPIEGINERAKPREVLAIEVDDQPGKMGQFRFVTLHGKGFA